MTVMTISIDRSQSHVSAASSQPIRDILAQRRWLQRTHPFPHVIAYDVFRPAIYRRLEEAFLELLEQTGGRPYMKAHDIYGRTVNQNIAQRLDPLLTRPWHDLLARILRINSTGHVAVGIHHHQVGSQHGFPHNDLNPGWFLTSPLPDDLAIAGSDIEYTTGTVLDETTESEPIETIRAASVLFYLANRKWEIGDGGGTGLYRSGKDDIERPVAMVPPLNNSMLMFECTPVSYHGFISNHRNPRNSIVMWLHRPKQEVVERWGERAIVPYGRVPRQKAGR
jgi:hypothetical protein